MAVGDRAQRAPDAGLGEKYRQARHHDGGDNRRRDVDLLEGHEAAEHFDFDRAARQMQVFGDHDLGFAAKHELPEADQQISQAEGGHEQDDVWLVDQGPQHQPLDRDREHEHHTDSEKKREVSGDIARRDAPTPQHRVEPDQRQRGEHHHDALREIEHARRLEDQHEAERDQRIEHARDQALPQRLHQEIGRLAHLHERIDEDFVEQVRQCQPQILARLR